MEYVTNSAFDHLPMGIARRYDSRYDVVIRTADDGTRTELQPMRESPCGEYVRFEDYAKLVEKCERLTKAGEQFAQDMVSEYGLKRCKCEDVYINWQAAKGGQS